MPSGHIQSLRDEADRSNATLEILVEPSQLDAIAQVVGFGDRLRFLSEPLHREMMDELRWTSNEAASRRDGIDRDGIDIATLEISEADCEVLKLLSSWPTMKRLREIGGGTGLETPSRDAIATASAFALLRYRSNGSWSRFEGGRALQRVWLRATSLGLSIQPMSVLVYLFERIENAETVGLDEETQTGLRALHHRYRELFPPRPHSTDLLLFRIAYADPPSVRSKRLRLDEIVA